MSSPQQALISYGAVASVYATWNPSDKNANIALSAGDLVATATNSSWKSVRATIGKASGKWYREYVVSASGGRNAMAGVAEGTASLSNYVGVENNSVGYYSYNGKTDGANAYRNNTNITYGGIPYILGDVLGVALNMDVGEVTFYKNNTSAGTLTGFSGTLYPMIALYDNTIYLTANFGATSLVYSPPSGFNAGLYT